MRPVPVPQATASRIEMELAVKGSQYLFSPVKVVQLEYLVYKACTRFDKSLKKTAFFGCK